MIAEYEKAKIAERYRRGKLFRARAGEITTWKTAYGYRRVARSAATGPAHLEIYEPEAVVVRRIFTDRAAGTTVREICRRLNADRVPSPTGKADLGHLHPAPAAAQRGLRRPGLLQPHRIGARPAARPPQPPGAARPRRLDPDRLPTHRHRRRLRGRRTGRRRQQPSGAHAAPNPAQWLLKGLVKCGVCGVGTNCHKMRGRNGTWHRYYYCRNHDPIRAGGEDRRCPERNIRADALDAFVFDQIRAALTPARPAAGRRTSRRDHHPDPRRRAARRRTRPPRPQDRHRRRRERRRLVDVYQAGLIELTELQRRAADVAARQRDLQTKRASLAQQRTALARGNQLRRRVHDFAERIRDVIDQLDDVQKQQLLRLLIEEVRVTGWHIEIRLRIALDPPTARPRHQTGHPTAPPTSPDPPDVKPKTVCVPLVAMTSAWWTSRSIIAAATTRRRTPRPSAEGLLRGDDQGGAFVAGGDELEEQVRGVGFEGQVADLVDDDQPVAAQPGQLVW